MWLTSKTDDSIVVVVVVAVVVVVVVVTVVVVVVVVTVVVVVDVVVFVVTVVVDVVTVVVVRLRRSASADLTYFPSWLHDSHYSYSSLSSNNNIKLSTKEIYIKS